MLTDLLKQPGIAVGEQFTSSCTVSAQDLELAVRLTRGAHPVHVSDEAARAAGLEGRIFHGAVSAAIMAAAIGARFANDSVALLAQSNCYLLPVYPGDTLATVWTVAAMRSTRQQGQSVLELKGTMLNQHGAAVIDAEAKVLLRATAESVQ